VGGCHEEGEDDGEGFEKHFAGVDVLRK